MIPQKIEKLGVDGTFFDAFFEIFINFGVMREKRKTLHAVEKSLMN